MKTVTFLSALLLTSITFAPVYGNPPAKVPPPVKTVPPMQHVLYKIPITVINNSTGDIYCAVSIQNYSNPIPCPGFVFPGFYNSQYQRVNAKQSGALNLMCIGPVVGPSIVEVDCKVPAAYPDKRVMYYSISGLKSLGPVIYTQIPDPNDPYLNKGTLTQ